MKIGQIIQRDLRYYMLAHRHRRNQQLHYFAFLFAFLGWIFLFINVWVTLVFAILHYSFAWIGHFNFERNKPAAFKYPWIGFYAGFIWFFLRTIELITRKRLLDVWIKE